MLEIRKCFIDLILFFFEIQSHNQTKFNDNNSCYIDSLLFAMFAYSPAFDYLLTKECSKTFLRLRIHLIIVVNQLRRGVLIERDTVNFLLY